MLSESGKYDVLDDVKRTSDPYPDIQNKSTIQASHEYLELSSSLNDHYDYLDEVDMQTWKSEDMASDGYLTPQPGINDDKYVSDGYLKPTIQKPSTTGDYHKPERTNDQTHDYLKLDNCQEATRLKDISI